MLLYAEHNIRAERLKMDSQHCDFLLQCLKTNMKNTDVASSKSSQSGTHEHSSSSFSKAGPGVRRHNDRPQKGARASSSPEPVQDKSCPTPPPPSLVSPPTAPSSEPHFTNATTTTAAQLFLQEIKNCVSTAASCSNSTTLASSASSAPTVSSSTATTSCSSPRPHQHHHRKERNIAPSDEDPREDASDDRSLNSSPQPEDFAPGSQRRQRRRSEEDTQGDIRDESERPSEEGSSGIMKQERGDSPPAEGTSFAKALSLASSSALANAVMSLSRLSAAAGGTSSSSSSAGGISLADSEAARQHLSAMLQGLPFLLPGLQRLAGPGGVSLAGVAGGGVSPGSGSLASAGGGGGGIMCVCGIRFACRSNMEAHRKFYCTHQHNPPTAEGASDSSNSSGSREVPEGGEEGGWGLLRCPQCPYTTTHKLSLNGHMNMHTATPEETHPIASPKMKSSVGVVVDARAAERYCTDCDIQFSSLKTFRVHKAHYCQTRHVHKANKSPARDEQQSAAAAVAAAAASLLNSNSSGQPILLLPTDPVLLVPYSVLIGASLLPSHILPQQGAAVLTPDGQIQPLSLAHLFGNNRNSVPPPILSPNFNVSASAPPAAPRTSSNNTSPQISPRATTNNEPSMSSKVKSENQAGSSEPTAAVKRRGDGESPLDLTTKRSKLSIKTDLMSDEEKENREVNTPSVTNSPAAARNGSSSGSVSGEFEGKLLASSPRASPSTDGGDRSTPRSPRPASAAPSLSSPRTAPQDSSRASTSAANRSPSQTSPTMPPSMLPQMPPGFSGLLGGLDGLSSLPFSSLQYLQTSPELLLKMFNGIVPPLPPPPSTPIKQGEARCKECNITFYKEENFLVHKKHYCAARDKSTDEDRQSGGQQSPAASRGSISPPSHLIKTELPPISNIPLRDVSTKPSKPLGQYVCNPCGIKFTSPDNLTAHQTYYCPKREGSTSEEGVTKGMWRCPRCRVAMPETLQAAHQCVSPGTSSAHGWKCPCCPMLSPTAAAAQKHLETHAGIKAFRCTICGYRGNTLRGMRTHIRMHFEKRTNDLQEENFIECILEDDDRRYRMINSHEMRMNLSEHQQALMENPALAAAILSSSGAPMSDAVEPPLSCTICSFVTSHRATFIKHLALVHKLGVQIKNFLDSHSGSSSTESKNLSESIDSHENGGGAAASNTSSPPLSVVKLEPEVKLEVPDMEEDVQMRSPSKSPCRDGSGGEASRNATPSPQARATSTSPVAKPVPNGLPTLVTTVAGRLSPSTVAGSVSSSVRVTGPNPSIPTHAEMIHHCDSCDISFSYLDSFLAHKRFYCRSGQSNTPPETIVQ